MAPGFLKTLEFALPIAQVMVRGRKRIRNPHLPVLRTRYAKARREDIDGIVARSGGNEGRPQFVHKSSPFFIPRAVLNVVGQYPAKSTDCLSSFAFITMLPVDMSKIRVSEQKDRVRTSPTRTLHRSG